MREAILIPTNPQTVDKELNLTLVQKIEANGKLNYWTKYYALLVENLNTGAWLVNDRGNLADTVIAKKDKLVSINGSKLINYETEVDEFIDLVNRIFQVYVHQAVKFSGDRGSRYSVHIRSLAGYMVQVEQIGKSSKCKALVNNSVMVNYHSFDNMLKVLKEFDDKLRSEKVSPRRTKFKKSTNVSRSLAMALTRKLDKLSFVTLTPVVVGEYNDEDKIKLNNRELTRGDFWRIFVHEESEDILEILTAEQLAELEGEEDTIQRDDVQSTITFLINNSTYPFEPGNTAKHLAMLFNNNEDDDY